MKVIVVSPEKPLFDGESTGVKLPGEKGRFEVLEGHAPLVTTLVAGQVICDGDAPFEVSIEGGFAEVSHNQVTVCVELQTMK